MYPPSLTGTAVVEVRIKNEHKKKTKNQNLMFIAMKICLFHGVTNTLAPRCGKLEELNALYVYESK